MCRKRWAWSTMALTTSGCEWPVALTAMPAAQSRKRLPSTSSTTDALAARHHQRIAARVGRRDDALVARDDGGGLRAGQRRPDVGRVHGIVLAQSGSLPLPARAARRRPRAGRRARPGPSRIRSAAAKSRRRRAAWRSSISRSISSAGTGGCASSARRSEITPSTRSNWSNASRMAGTSPAPTCPCVDRRVERAHQFEHRAEAAGGVQVVAIASPNAARASSTRAGTLGVAPPAVHRVEPRQEVGQPPQRLLGLLQAVPRELQLLAVVRSTAAGSAAPTARKPRATMSGIVKTLPSDFDIFCSSTMQVLDVEPEARERLAGRAFALRNLVLVVREHEVDAAGVDVDRRLAEQPQRHRRALEVPARPPGADAELPGRLARLAWPSTARSRARPPCRSCRSRRGRRLDALVIEARQLAVVGHRRDLEVDRAVALGRCGPSRVERARSCRPSRAGSPRRSRAASPRPARGRAPRQSSRNAAMYWSVYSRSGHARPSARRRSSGRPRR